MQLWYTRKVWEKLARQDPFWAVLTDPTKSSNRWGNSEFFATGQKTVDIDITAINRSMPNRSTDLALDFGCGVGRLSQGLAAHFKHVDGVDIAQPMIDLAREHNRYGDRVTYHHNPSKDLSLFPDNRFDLVYSVITLQHIPAALIPTYLKEFVRVDFFPTSLDRTSFTISVFLVSSHSMETRSAVFTQKKPDQSRNEHVFA